ncbi:hypothetical protein G6F24_018190 [Rhizopus arrhizus]|nr:hypothetical protein G6F24_018190 [Rhizopus arrhizus]
MNLVDDQVIARLYGPTHPQIAPTDDETSNRQQPDQPRVCIASVGGPIKCMKEESGGAAGQAGDDEGDDQPFAYVGQEV